MPDALFEYLEKEGVEYVRRSIAYTNSKNYKNYPDYLATVLRNNYGKNYVPEQPDRFSKSGARRAARNRAETERLGRESEKRRQLAEERKRQDALLAVLTPEQDAELAALAENEIMKNTNEIKRYEKQKHRGVTPILDRYKRFLVEEFAKERGIVIWIFGVIFGSFPRSGF